MSAEREAEVLRLPREIVSLRNTLSQPQGTLKAQIAANIERESHFQREATRIESLQHWLCRRGTTTRYPQASHNHLQGLLEETQGALNRRCNPQSGRTQFRSVNPLSVPGIQLSRVLRHLRGLLS